MAEEDAAMDDWGDVLADDGKPEDSDTAGQDLQQEEPAETDQPRPIDFIIDIPLDISVELGRARMLINNLLQLGPGSIIELNKMAGEPMEIFINNKLVAKGEVIVVNEKLAIRLTDIVTPIERIESLR